MIVVSTYRMDPGTPDQVYVNNYTFNEGVELDDLESILQAIEKKEAWDRQDIDYIFAFEFSNPKSFRYYKVSLFSDGDKLLGGYVSHSPGN